MTIPQRSSRFSMIGSRARSQWLFLEKLCHYSCAFIYKPIIILYHTSLIYDNILDKFEFERSVLRPKSRSWWLFLEKKHCHYSGALIYYPINFDNADNVNTVINSLASECIPNKHVRIKPLDPPWITFTFKRYIRKRKRAYKGAKRTNLDFHWNSFKQIRNRVIKMIRDSKQQHYDKIVEKLRSNTLSTNWLDWWST